MIIQGTVWLAGYGPSARLPSRCQPFLIFSPLATRSNRGLTVCSPRRTISEQSPSFCAACTREPTDSVRQRLANMVASGPSESTLAPLRHCTVANPRAGVLLVTIHRPKSLNSLTVEASYELESVFRWFDQQPSLKVAVITGAGKAFCVGADLKGASIQMSAIYYCLYS